MFLIQYIYFVVSPTKPPIHPAVYVQTISSSTPTTQGDLWNIKVTVMLICF